MTDYAELEKRLRAKAAFIEGVIRYGNAAFAQKDDANALTEAADAIAALTRELEEAGKRHSTNVAQLLVAIEPFAMAAPGLHTYSGEMCILRGSICFSRDPAIHITVDDLRRAHHVNEMVWKAIGPDPALLSTAPAEQVQGQGEK